MSKFKDRLYYLIGYENKNRIKQLRLKMMKPVMSTLKLNEKFRGIHQGDRCFIIGNGPSISRLNFEKLADEYTFTVNQFARFNGFEKLKTNFHLFGDERVFYLKDSDDLNIENLNYIKKLNESSSDIQFFLVYSSKKFIEKSECFKNAKVNYFSNVIDFYDGFNEGFDLTKSIPWFPTCIDYCIAIAMFMGFNEIYLLGCECTGFLKVTSIDSKNATDYSYGYSVSSNESDRIKQQVKVYGVADELEMWVKILRYYDYFEKYSKLKHIKIVNCTDGGILESFERKSLDDVLRQ